MNWWCYCLGRRSTGGRKGFNPRDLNLLQPELLTFTSTSQWMKVEMEDEWLEHCWQARYTAKLLFQQSLNIAQWLQGDYHCDDVVTHSALGTHYHGTHMLQHYLKNCTHLTCVQEHTGPNTHTYIPPPHTHTHITDIVLDANFCKRMSIGPIALSLYSLSHSFIYHINGTEQNLNRSEIQDNKSWALKCSRYSHSSSLLIFSKQNAKLAQSYDIPIPFKNGKPNPITTLQCSKKSQKCPRKNDHIIPDIVTN